MQEVKMRKVSIAVVMASVVMVMLFSGARMPAKAAAKETGYVHMNKMIDKLERGQVVSGIWLNCLHPSMAIALTRFNGFPTYEESVTKPMIDFVLIDLEHEPFDVAALRNFMLAMNSRREALTKGNLQPNVATMVRIPEDAEGSIGAMVKQVLDCGAHSVIVPHVRHAEDAKKFVSACRYPQPKNSPIYEPAGHRGAGPKLPAYLWGMDTKEYIKRADVWPLDPKGDILAVIMIEDELGVKNIDEILKVKGVGAVIFGPYDYSFATGHPGSPGHPSVAEGLAKVKKACDKHNVPLIGFVKPHNVIQKIEDNFKMLFIGHDFDLGGRAGQNLKLIREHQKTKKSK